MVTTTTTPKRPLTEAERARRRLRVFAFAIAFLFGALALANWWTNRDHLRAGSEALDDQTQDVRIDDVPTSYHAVFQIENRAGADVVYQTERVWVRRPFASRIETYAGPAPGTRRQSVRRSAFGVLANESAGAAQALHIATPPSLASGDLRIDAVLEEALRTKALVEREVRNVFGRRCRVYRAGGPVTAGDITPYRPGSDTYADVCVDEHGLVLEEYWVDDGELIRRRVATELEVEPSIPRDLLSIDKPEDPSLKQGVVQRVDRDAGEQGDLWTFDDPPKGFERLGRYVVVMPEQALPNFGGGAPPPPVSSTTDVFVRGADVLVVDQDPSLQSLTALENRPTRRVDLDGDLGRATLIVDARTSEIRVPTPDGSLVRIFGTIASEELIDLAEELERSGR